MRTLAALALVVTLPVGVRAQRPLTPNPQNDRLESERAAVRFDPGTVTAAASITLDALATDTRGRAVENLRPADFELTVDGAPQPVDTVAAVRNGTVPNAGTGRLFAIFLDEFHTSPTAASAIGSVLTRFVDEQLRPDDRVVVMRPLDSLFTIAPAPDRAAVRDAVATFDGRKGILEPRTAFERTFMGHSPESIARLRRQVTVSALNALAVRLGSLGAGRKAILLVSEGFQPTAPIRGEELLPTVAGVVKNANRRNVAIYGVNPAEETSDADVLRTMAAGTDGQTGGGDLAYALMQRMTADSSSYYLLTWQPPAADGRFHAVQVRVKRAGVNVRTRAGVWVLPPEEPVTPAGASAYKPASPFESTPRHASPLIDAWFGMARAADGRTRVTFVWEPNRRASAARARRPSTPSRIDVKAFTLDGAPLYDGAVRPTGLPSETDAGAKAVFEAPPGRVHFQMSITGDDGKQLDVDTRDIAVRDLREATVIGTPEILRARTALEFRALAADLEAAPVAARTFSRAERLLVRFFAYVPAGDHAAVTARLVSRAGQTMRTFDAVAVEGAPDLRQIDLPLNGFAPGEYMLELAVAAAGGSAKELVNFRVTG